MKKPTRLIAILICFALFGVSVPGALYWDSNGTAAGAGTAPNGIWGTSTFWNTTADGTTTAPGAWLPGEDAYFSAGADATNTFTVTISGTQTAGNLTVEEGMVSFSGGTGLNIGGGITGKGVIDIASGLTNTMNTVLSGGDDTGQITKAGDGTLIINASCTHPGAMMITGGTLKLGASNLLNTNSDLSIGGPCVFDMNGFDQTIDGLSGLGTINNVNGGTLTVGQNNEMAATFSGGIGTPYDPSPIALIKIGTGTQTLAGFSAYTGLTIVKAGVLAVSDADALGTIDPPTVVSNGAAVHTRSGLYETVIVSGEGFSGVGGALRNISGTTDYGGVILGSNARINNDAGGTWNWQGGVGGNLGVDGTSVGGSFSVTFGGNGGTTQLKNSYRTIILNNAPLFKDGTSTLRFETPTIGVSACYLDGGWILSRTASAGNFLPAGSPIYVGAGAGGFLTGQSASPSLYSPMVLALGANPVFNIQPNLGGDPQTWNQDGVISGLGGLSKTNVGTMFLNRHNTYSGNTTIQSGPLVLGANGSISNSLVIDVQSLDSVFNVTSNVNGFVLQPAQTLKGNGTVLGSVTASGTVAPGASIGRLTFSNNLTLATSAKLLFEVDRALQTNDVIAVSGVLSNSDAGLLTVNNLGPALMIGDTFHLFKDDANNNKPLLNGQTVTVTGGGVTWTNKLAVDGSISVVSLAPPPVVQVPSLTSITVGGPITVHVTWTNVVFGSNYWLQYNTNLNTTNWYDLGSVTAWGPTASRADGFPAGSRQRYYRVRTLASGGPSATMPRITSVTLPGTTVVTVNYTNTLAGTNYVLQYRTNLNTTNWTSLSPVTAGGTTASATDTISAGSTQRFYRVYYVTQ